MKSYSLESFKLAIQEAGVGQSAHTLIHSSLLSLGKLEQYAVNNIPKVLFDCLNHAGKEQQNLYMPAFNYEFPKTRTADLAIQPTELGVWPEWFRKQQGVRRSGHPMFSICGYGPNAEEICRPDIAEPDSFGEQSTYARLFKENALFLFLGIGIQVATPVVYCESRLQVKYRFYKPFDGCVKLQNGEQVEKAFFHFCYPMTNEYRNDFGQLEAGLLTQGLMKKIPIGMSYLYAIKAQDLFAYIANQIKTEPYFLLNKMPERFYQYVNGEEVLVSA